MADPTTWNVKRLIPAAGVGAATAWGVFNVFEHQLQEGHAPQWLMRNPLLLKITQHTPFINVVYGALNAAGAFANGYGWRGTAFSLYTLASGAAIPAVMADNRMATEIARQRDALHGLMARHTSPEALKALAAQHQVEAIFDKAAQGMGGNTAHLIARLHDGVHHAGADEQRRLASMVQELMQTAQARAPEEFARIEGQMEKWAAQGAKLRPITRLVNNTVPIGLLLGLFTFTKVAQSSPGVKLEHTHGNSLREMWQGAPDGEPLPSLLLGNFKKESAAVVQAALHPLSGLKQGTKAVGQGLQDLVHPAPAEADKRPNAWHRFVDPISQSPIVPQLYAWAGFGRVLAAATALGLFFLERGKPPGTPLYQDLKAEMDSLKRLASGQAEAASVAATAGFKDTLKGTNALLLMGGQFAGAFSALFTQFNDWPAWLSSIYMTSSVPYLASAFSSVLRRSIGPFDAPAWAKFGAFIQGTSYFVNLVVQSYEKKEPGQDVAPPEPAGPDFSGEHPLAQRYADMRTLLAAQNHLAAHQLAAANVSRQ
jgi:hypothetical protein